MSVSDDQVRATILELLYKRAKEAPESSGVDRAIIQDTLKDAGKLMDDNITFLEQKGLVTLSKGDGKQWTFAKISLDGVEVIEDKERYAAKFSLVQALTSQTPEGDQEAISEREQSPLSFDELLRESFKQAYDQIRAANLPMSDRGKIEKQLREFEKELQKTKKADLGSIQKSWDWLNKYAHSLTPVIAPAVMETIKIRLELP